MARVLLVGPEKERAVGVRSLLRQDGHHVSWTRSVGDWRSQEREVLPDVVVATVGSPDGVLSRVREQAGAGFAPPLLFVAQEGDFPRELSQQARLVDRITSPFMGDELLGRVDALVRVRQVVLRQAAPGAQAIRRRGAVSGSGLAHVFSWLRARLPREKPAAPYLEVAARLADWADRRDAFKPGHAERVTLFCAMIADALGLDDPERSELLRASMLHDIGKVALPVEVLHQKRPLEESQVRLIRTHPARGAALLRALDPDEQVARVVLYHHECPDGTGYYGKPAGGVPRAAYVLSVAEAYDAMTSSLLREPLTMRSALDFLQSTKGARYDADAVEALEDQLRPRTTCIPLSPGPLGQVGRTAAAGRGQSSPS